jgi:8-oxo-dGTP diphosphatase
MTRTTLHEHPASDGPRTPAVAVDIIIELADRSTRPIVLVKRRNHPHGWALPGGFVDLGESVERAAVREALEETSLSVRLVRLLGVYSEPGRDPRGHTVSVVFVAEGHGEPSAADDAKSVAVCSLEHLPHPLAFDHKLILRDYGRSLAVGERTPSRVSRAREN